MLCIVYAGFNENLILRGFRIKGLCSNILYVKKINSPLRAPGEAKESRCEY